MYMYMYHVSGIYNTWNSYNCLFPLFLPLNAYERTITFLDEWNLFIMVLKLGLGLWAVHIQ